VAGLTTGRLPRFVKRYADMHDGLLDAARRYAAGAVAATAPGHRARARHAGIGLGED
jgi:3-methyl-2-oxobutanoate hydroxymethyltransferase